MSGSMKTRTRLGALLSVVFVLGWAHASQAQQAPSDSIPNLEDRLLTDIKDGGQADKFVIRSFKPKAGELVCRVTFRPIPPGEKRFSASIVDFAADEQGYLAGYWVKGPSLGPGFVIDTEWPADRYCIPVTGQGLQNTYLWGVGSIHRFDGTVTINDVTFSGTGHSLNRLTFVVLDRGYVYLRGDGCVKTSDGKKVKLGGGQCPTETKKEPASPSTSKKR
jgi:hypothetical protein